MKAILLILLAVLLDCISFAFSSPEQNQGSMTDCLDREKIRAFSYIGVSKNIRHGLQVIKKMDT